MRKRSKSQLYLIFLRYLCILNSQKTLNIYCHWSDTPSPKNQNLCVTTQPIIMRGADATIFDVLCLVSEPDICKYKQKPDIYRCIRSSLIDRLGGFYAEIQISFRHMVTLNRNISLIYCYITTNIRQKSVHIYVAQKL